MRECDVRYFAEMANKLSNACGIIGNSRASILSALIIEEGLESVAEQIEKFTSDFGQIPFFKLIEAIEGLKSITLDGELNITQE